MAVHCVFFSVYLFWKESKGFSEISYLEYVQTLSGMINSGSYKCR